MNELRGPLFAAIAVLALGMATVFVLERLRPEPVKAVPAEQYVEDHEFRTMTEEEFAELKRQLRKERGCECVPECECGRFPCKCVNPK